MLANRCKSVGRFKTKKNAIQALACPEESAAQVDQLTIIVTLRATKTRNLGLIDIIDLLRIQKLLCILLI